MKKVFLAIGLLFSGSAFGITHTVVNAMPVPVQVQLDLRMAPDEYVPLAPGEIKKVSVGAFPLRSVIAEGLDGIFAGKTAKKRIMSARPWGRIIVVGRFKGELVVMVGSSLTQ